MTVITSPTGPAARVRTAPFLAPHGSEEQKPAPLACDCGEVTMDRLRHPFAVAADTDSTGD